MLRICGQLDEQVTAYDTRPLDHTGFPYVFLDATYCKARLNGRVVSQAVVIATGVTADGRRGLLVSAVESAGLLVAFPVAAAVAGSTVAGFTTVSAKVTSGVQHFAAGVVFAAVAVEVLPDLREDGHLVSVVIAFAAGVVGLLSLSRFSDTLEARNSARIVPVGLVIAVGIDLFIDGLLVGVGATVGLK